MNNLRCCLQTVFLCCTTIALLVIASLVHADSGEVPKDADTIFIGTVTSIGSASFAAVPISSQVMVVRLDQVISQPRVLDLHQNEKITVKAKRISDFKPGVQAVFYTTGWMIGDGVAVTEIKHFLTHSMMAQGASSDDVKQLVEKKLDSAKKSDLKQKLNAANLVLVGRILSVRPAPLSVQHSTLQGGPTEQQRAYISEHDPQWKDAVVQIESLIKGHPKGSQVVVRFPGSPDIAWRSSPKLKEGQEATFILRQTGVEGPVTLGQGTVRPYLTITRSDILNKDEADTVRQLVK